MQVAAFFSIVLLMGLLLAGCSRDQLTDIPKPFGYKRLFLRSVPEGNTPFALGWRAGCNTFLSVSGTGKLHFIPQQVNGYDITADPDYRTGYENGAAYCANFLDYN